MIAPSIRAIKRIGDDSKLAEGKIIFPFSFDFYQNSYINNPDPISMPQFATPLTKIGYMKFNASASQGNTQVSGIKCIQFSLVSNNHVVAAIDAPGPLIIWVRDTNQVTIVPLPLSVSTAGAQNFGVVFSGVIPLVASDTSDIFLIKIADSAAGVAQAPQGIISGFFANFEMPHHTIQGSGYQNLAQFFGS